MEQREQRPNVFGLCRVATEEGEANLFATKKTRPKAIERVTSEFRLQCVYRMRYSLPANCETQLVYKKRAVTLRQRPLILNLKS